MTTGVTMEGNRIRLRQISLQDCTDTYVEWLNDPLVNQFLETRWLKQDLNTVTRFVKEQIDNDHSFLFAIIESTSNSHIGNIKIGPINRNHKHADISYFIGDRSYWGKGIATEAIHLICEFGFKVLLLHRIEAGVYSNNTSSWMALEKNGFVREGKFREQVLSGSHYMDVYRYGRITAIS